MTRPADTTSFAASSSVMSSGITSRRGTNSRKPAVGFGVVGRNTLTMSGSPALAGISPRVSVATKATAQRPRRGYSTRHAFWNEVPRWLSTVSTICFSPL